MKKAPKAKRKRAEDSPSVQLSEPFNANKPGIKSESAVSPLPRLAYTLRETAEILGISYISVYRLCAQNKLKSSNALRHKLVPRTEIESFLKTTCQ